MKILLIEDNDLNRKLVEKIIQRTGHHFLAAADALSGIAAARVEKPALILMDIDLPGMDGITATGILKRDPATCLIPVIAFTASAMKGDREAILSAGFDDYISKPIGYHDFVDRLDKWLGKDHAAGTKPSGDVIDERNEDERA